MDGSILHWTFIRPPPQRKGNKTNNSYILQKSGWELASSFHGLKNSVDKMKKAEKSPTTEWDDIASTWDEIMREGNWFQWYIIYPTLSHVFPDWKHKKVLDVGCGNGHLCRFFKKLGADPVGIDISNEMIECCKKHGEDIEYYAMDITSTIMQKGNFDLVVFNNSLQDMKDYLSGIKRMSHVEIGWNCCKLRKTSLFSSYTI